MQYHTTRRSVLTATGLTLAGTGLVGSASASSTFSQQLNTVRNATTQYRDVETARDDGYDGLVSPYVPGMGFHFANPALIAPDENADGDLTNPPILVYFPNGSYNPRPGEHHDPTRDDDLILGGVEFAHNGTANADADYFDDENANRQVKVPEEHGWHSPEAEPFTALHVWVHRGNPKGVFHGTNPTIG